MIELFGIPLQAWLGQLILGLVNGSFYAILSLGLAIIFGMLNVINFSHGTMYMMGAYGAWMTLNCSRRKCRHHPPMACCSQELAITIA